MKNQGQESREPASGCKAFLHINLGGPAAQQRPRQEPQKESEIIF